MSEPAVVVRAVGEDGLRSSLRLLEDLYREGETVSNEFEKTLKGLVRRGDLEVLSASEGGEVVGVLTLAFRPSISLGGEFASIEDVYVEPGHRGRGVGKALLREAERRCGLRGVSYLEAQVEDDAAPFYEASGFDGEGVRVMSRSLPLGVQNSRTS